MALTIEIFLVLNREAAKQSSSAVLILDLSQTSEQCRCRNYWFLGFPSKPANQKDCTAFIYAQ